MTEDQLPDRVRAAEERREFRQLLKLSSIGKPPKGYEREPAVGSGMCETCRDDRCGELDCVMTGCACTCAADRATLTEHLLDSFAQSPGHLSDVARDLYVRGWRRQ